MKVTIDQHHEILEFPKIMIYQNNLVLFLTPDTETNSPTGILLNGHTNQLNVSSGWAIELFKDFHGEFTVEI